MSGRKPQVPEPVDEADAVILVGGYEGTFTAANWARQSGTPVLPVASFGMAAKDILADELNERAGRRVTRLSDDDLKKLQRSASTLDEGGLADYATEVIRLAEAAALSREVFIVMSFADQSRLDDFRDAVKMACEQEGFVAQRVDERPTGESYDIVEKIHREIEACGFVVADLSNERPNVYYEIGYARGSASPSSSPSVRARRSTSTSPANNASHGRVTSTSATSFGRSWASCRIASGSAVRPEQRVATRLLIRLKRRRDQGLGYLGASRATTPAWLVLRARHVRGLVAYCSEMSMAWLAAFTEPSRPHWP